MRPARFAKIFGIGLLKGDEPGTLREHLRASASEGSTRISTTIGRVVKEWLEKMPTATCGTLGDRRVIDPCRSRSSHKTLRVTRGPAGYGEVRRAIARGARRHCAA